MQSTDAVDNFAFSLQYLAPAILLPNVRSLLPPASYGVWLGDRVLGAILGCTIIYSSSFLAANLIESISWFLLSYYALLEQFIEAGMGPGVWGIKLNAALISSAGRLWVKYVTLLTDALPSLHDAFWAQASFRILLGVALYCVACGWRAGFALFMDLLRTVFLPLLVVQHGVAQVFRVALSILFTLCRLLIGRKYNVLRLRVDSHDFDMEHYTLGTVFFTLIFFLFPTVAFMHGFVSAPLLFVVYPFFILLRAIAAFPSQVPLVSLVLWAVRSKRIAAGVKYVSTPHGLVAKQQLQSLGTVLLPMWNLSLEPLLDLIPAFFLGRRITGFTL